MSLHPFDFHPCWGIGATKWHFLTRRHFYWRQEHAVNTTVPTRVASIHSLCQIVRHGTTNSFSAVSRAGLAWLCVHVVHVIAGVRPLWSFTSVMDSSFPSALLSQAFFQNTDTHTHTYKASSPLPASIITTNCNQSPEWSLASFCILFAITCLSSLHLFHPLPSCLLHLSGTLKQCPKKKKKRLIQGLVMC